MSDITMMLVQHFFNRNQPLDLIKSTEHLKVSSSVSIHTQIFHVQIEKRFHPSADSHTTLTIYLADSAYRYYKKYLP